jgi:4-diphosphocytidyl-2C-methyl-D-erythritol kinase
LLELFQRFFRKRGALAALMSGSGSTTFALFADEAPAKAAAGAISEEFGPTNWTAAVPLMGA